MLVDPDERPSFYKLLFKEGFTDKLLMPSAFVKENKNMLAKTCLLKTDERVFWKAKIVRDKSGFFICEGDWSQFVVYHELELGDVLLFFLIDKSTFQVLPYKEKRYKNLSGRQVFEELSSRSEEEEGDGDEEEEEREEEEEEREAEEEEREEEEEDTGPSRKSKKRTTQAIKSSDNLEEEDVVPSRKSRKRKTQEDVVPSRKSKKCKTQAIKSSDNFEDEDAVPSRKSKKRKTQAIKLSDNFEEEDVVPSRKSKKRQIQEIVLSDNSEEERDDSSSGSKDGNSPCYSHSGSKSNAKADNLVSMKKEAPGLTLLLKACKDKPKRPANSMLECKRDRWAGPRPDRDPEKRSSLQLLSSFSWRSSGSRSLRRIQTTNVSAVSVKPVGTSGNSCQELRKLLTYQRQRKGRPNIEKTCNERVVAGSAEGEESNKSRSEVDNEEEAS